MSVSAHGGEITPPTGGIFDWQPLVSLGEYIGLSPAILVSATVLVIAYAFIISEKINRAVVALIGAGMMIFLGVMNQHTAVQGIDFNTIFLLIGMMAIVGITKNSGVFPVCCHFDCKNG